MQGRVKDASVASDLRAALVHFLGEMNYPEDLLTYSADFLESTPQREGPAEVSADTFDAHTDLGRFLRQVSLALRAMPFEVPPLTSTGAVCPCAEALFCTSCSPRDAAPCKSSTRESCNRTEYAMSVS